MRQLHLIRWVSFSSDMMILSELPVIRSEIRNLKARKFRGHYTVYLPASSDEFILKKLLQSIQTRNLQVFS